MLSFEISVRYNRIVRFLIFFILSSFPSKGNGADLPAPFLFFYSILVSSDDHRKLRIQLSSDPCHTFCSTSRRICSVTGPLRAMRARIAACSSSTLISS